MGLLSEIRWRMYEQAFFFPLRWSVGLAALNDRVSAWDLRMERATMNMTPYFGWQNVRLTAPAPIVR